MSRMHLARAAMALMGFIGLSALLTPPETYGQLTATDLYVVNVLKTLNRYSGPIDAASRRGDVLSASRLYKACANDLYSIPIFGVDPQVVATVRSTARALDSLGSAILELNDPTVPDQLKAARAIELLARLADLVDQIERLQRR